ncbi:desulfoferrodoxin family protein [Acidobacteriota bacterium]
MKMKSYPMTLSIILLTGLLLISFSCSEKEIPAKQEEVTSQTEAAESKPASESVETGFFTKENPGPWAGKEGGHIPVVMYEKIETGMKVTVTVKHEMNAEKNHFIEWIRLRGGEGQLLGEQAFQVDSEKAEAVFELADIPVLIKVFAKCNLHGLWLNEVEVSIED